MTDIVAFLRARLDEDEASHGEFHDWHCPASDDALGILDCTCGHPARLLRQLAANRRSLADHLPCLRPNGDMETGICITVRTLAGVWSDHEDFDEAWR